MNSIDELITELHTQLIEKERIINDLNDLLDQTLKEYKELENRINEVINIIDSVLKIGIKDYNTQLKIIKDILKGE